MSILRIQGALFKFLTGFIMVAAGLVLGQGRAAALTNFSTGMLTPETISPANGAYGGTYDAYYFVPDPGRVSGDPAQTKVWLVPKAGGSPMVFAPTSGTLNTTTVGGVFLPSGWGSDANKFVTVGWTGMAYPRVANFNVYESGGSYRTPLSLDFASTGGQEYLPKTPVVAPAGWGAVGGNLLIADGGPAVYRIDPSWQRYDFVTTTPYPETARFGLAFAPADWGAVGGKLMASSDLRETDGLGTIIRITGRITAIDSSGVESIWAEFPIPVNLNGLRQMAFAPEDFIPGYEELLLVSVSNSHSGGGNLGDIWAFDQTGRKVASLRDDLGLDKFDPRGMYFVDDHTLLVSDASDPIWMVESSDFKPVVPLPSTFLLLGTVLAGLAGWRRYNKV